MFIREIIERGKNSDGLGRAAPRPLGSWSRAWGDKYDSSPLGVIEDCSYWLIKPVARNVLISIKTESEKSKPAPQKIAVE